MPFRSHLPRRRGLSIPARVALLAATFAALLVGLDGWHSWNARLVKIVGDKVEASNLTRSLAQHTHDLVRDADGLLSETRQYIETGGAVVPAGAAWQLASRVSGLPPRRGFFVNDADGAWLTTPMAHDPPDLDQPGRDYFRYHLSHPDRGLHVGDPVFSRSEGQWVVILSRRVDGPGGRFAGVVLTMIPVAELQAFYATFALGAHGMVALMMADGVLVVRHPTVDNRPVGVDVSANHIFKNYLPFAATGSFDYTSSGGVRRIGSYRRVEDYPFVIVVAHDLDEVLADWYADAWLHLVISLTAATLLGVLGYRFARQIASRQEAETRYRLLAEHSRDVIVCLDLNLVRRYVSPAVTAMTGWTPAESLGHPPNWFAGPEDQPLLTQIGARLRGGSEQETATFRYVCKDGSLLWVEACYQLVAAADGREAQIIGNIRDISARKVAEEQLAAVNRELSAQATTDGLTGLANRRRLDDAFQQAWRRASREEQPLSLLLIDVDRFKAFNDRYGHQAGDRCLHAVARALAGQLRRPDDLAARYGGEEFAVLLPGTDETGAAEIAEWMRGAIAGLRVTHAGNPPFGVVTASIGVATLWREETTMAVEALLARADAALYQAKNSGRNRVVTEGETVPLHEVPRLGTFVR